MNRIESRHRSSSNAWYLFADPPATLPTTLSLVNAIIFRSCHWSRLMLRGKKHFPHRLLFPFSRLFLVLEQNENENSAKLECGFVGKERKLNILRCRVVPLPELLRNGKSTISEIETLNIHSQKHTRNLAVAAAQVKIYIWKDLIFAYILVLRERKMSSSARRWLLK